MAFVKIGSVKDLPPGASKTFEVKGRSIAVCNVNGEIYAIDDVCTHDEGPLGEGALEGYEIECPRHGARFDVRTGEVTALPAAAPVDTFKVRVHGDDIEIEV